MIVEKSLPALPPNEIPKGAFSNEKVDPDSDTPTEISPRPRQGHRPSTSASRSSSRPARSPERAAKQNEGLGLSSNAYRSNRSSTLTGSDSNDKDDGFFIPVALDPSPAPTPTSVTSANDSSKRKDYFNLPKSSLSEKRNDSPSSTPHIAFQDKGRQYSSDRDVNQTKGLSRKLSQSSRPEHKQSSPSVDERAQRAPPRSQTGFEDANPKGRRVPGSSSSSSSSVQQDGGVAVKGSSGAQTQSEPRKNGDLAQHEQRRPDQPDIRQSVESNPKAGARKDVPPSSSRNGQSVRESQSSPKLTNFPITAPPRPQQQRESDEGPPPRIPPPRLKTGADQTHANYTKSRAQPSHGQGSAKTAGAGKDDQTSPKHSPSLPHYSNGGDFTMEEDMARILGTDQTSSSILRRASNIAKHGRTNSIESGHAPSRANHTRSISETTRGTVSPHWNKHSSIDDRSWASPEVASPVSASSPEDAEVLRRQLRTSEQRVAELERQFNNEKNLENLDKKLMEKRKTVSVLDTQTEIMIRQLEVLAGYVERAKDSKKPIDPRELEDSAIKDFVQKLEQVKNVLAASIEQLHEERDRVMEEKEQAFADRDRALMEFEQLSSKNAQLAEMNNEMTHQLQERFKNQVGGDGKSTNGLGIYGENKAAMASSVHLDSSSTAGATLVATDDDPIVEHGPTVVQVRKGQVKKFNWKKGSKGLAQNVAKGVNRAVVAFQNDRPERIGQPVSVGDIGVPYNATVAPVESPATPAPPIPSQNRQPDHTRQGFGFFSSKKATPVPKSSSANNVVSSLAPEAPSTLFGSDLTERADWERRQIPTVVTRCIEEVELRGMDQEGIYRKTGGNSQINMIKDGFERNESFDISDPDWDITAVTSVLKQYFRKLPTPLLTFEVYDRILESNCSYPLPAQP